MFDQTTRRVFQCLFGRNELEAKHFFCVPARYITYVSQFWFDLLHLFHE